MNIPDNQFYIFTVTSLHTNCNLGVYFTFGQAYERISEMANGTPLVEENTSLFTDDSRIIYYPENDPEDRYIIHARLLTYFPSETPHLVTFDDMNKNDVKKISLLR